MNSPVSSFLRANQTLLFLCVTTALLTTGQGIAAPILPLYASALHVSTAQVGLVITAFGLARFLTNMPAALLSNRFGRKALLVGGPLIAAAGNTLVPTADTLGPLLVYRFIAGIGSAAFITGAIIFISDISTRENRGRLLSVYQGSFTLGITLGPAMGGLIAEAFGLGAPFIAIGVVSLAGGIWALFRIPETHRRAQAAPLTGESDGLPGHRSGEPTLEAGVQAPGIRGKLSAHRFLLSRDFMIISLVFIGAFFTRGGAQFTLLPLKAAERLSLSPGQIGALFTIPPVLSFAAIFVVGYLSDRYGRKAVLVPGVLASSGCLMLLGLSDTVLLFGLGMAVYGVSQAMESAPAVAYVADISPPGRQAVAQGAARSLGDLALLVAPPLMGLAADAQGVGFALVGNGLLLAGIGVTLLLFARDPHRQTLTRTRQEGRAGA